MHHAFIQDLPLPDSLGVPIHSELLKGMGYGRAYRVDTEQGRFVLKGSREKRERLFYERIAPAVNAAGVSTPELLWSYQDSALSWVALEWITVPLPESRWQADDEVLGQLAVLHNLNPDLQGVVPETLAWTRDMNNLALSVCPGKIVTGYKAALEDLRCRHQSLFEPACFLSGDPSGRNWGVRENGQLVLYDWERFGFGMPQLDLACVAFGEPPRAVFRDIANGYVHHHHPVVMDIEQFTRDIEVARIHCCINMLCSHVRGTGHFPPKIVTLTVEGLGQLLNRVCSGNMP